MLIAGVTFVAWFAIERWRRPVLGGVLIGLCAVLKPFLLVLFIPLILRRNVRAALSGAVTFLVSNAVPMLIAGMMVGDIVSALGETFSKWFAAESNISFGGLINRIVEIPPDWVLPLHLVVLVIWIFVMSLRARPSTVEWLGWVVAAVALSPIAWPHYLVVVVPFVWLTLLDPAASRLTKIFVGLGLIPFLPYQTDFYAIGFLLLAVGVVISGRETADRAKSWIRATHEAMGT
jgi:hypothetical protein